MPDSNCNVAPPEYFALTVFGLSMLASIGDGSPIKNVMAGAFGVLLATVGIDLLTTVERFTFGNKMERDETRRLNMELLDDDGGESFQVIHPLAAGAVTAAHRARARSLSEGLDPGPWGFKDPRTLLTFRFWQDMLEEPRLVGRVVAILPDADLRPVTERHELRLRSICLPRPGMERQHG